MNNAAHITTNHLSLCSGIGGMDLGLKRVVKGLRTVAYVEGEAFPTNVLVQKMAEGWLDSAPIYPDLRRFSWEKYRGLVDFITGGFPCQPFSSAGSRKAVEDDRHLWPYIKQGIGIIRPRAVFFENVDGIASCKSPGYHSVLHNVFCDLEEMGYSAEAGVYTAEEVGAPHTRRRWFILGVANSYIEGLEGHTRHVQRQERQGQGGQGLRSTAKSCLEEVADTGHICREVPSCGEQPTKQQFRSNGQAWPAGPGERQHEWEPPRTVVLPMGGSSNGFPSRVDRLRALGNACVPEVAAIAFTDLWSRFASSQC